MKESGGAQSFLSCIRAAAEQSICPAAADATVTAENRGAAIVFVHRALLPVLFFFLDILKNKNIIII